MSLKKILVVDDSLTSLMWQRMILGQEQQYDVVTASDGQEGVERALKERPDLILMDVVMPKMNGFEACRAIRANGATSRVPVIMVTTKGAPDNVEEGYKSGCSDYIMKPIDKLELLSKVKSHLGKK